MSKLPSLQFYPGDWLRDPVSGCSLAAQGLWLRMLILMHDSERYGYLVMNGSPIPSGFVARKCGCDTLAQYETLLAELDSAAVPSRTSDGILYSRRLVRDQKEREKNRQRVLQHRLKRSCNASCNGDVTPNEDEGEDEVENSSPKSPKPPSPAEEIYALYPRKVARVAAIKAINAVLAASGPEMKTRLRERVAAYAEAVAKWAPADRQFVPHPATWFNRGSFDDDPVTWVRESSTPQQAKFNSAFAD